ncbi:hypothetical protein [Kitasatospora sp. NPDC004289]
MTLAQHLLLPPWLPPAGTLSALPAGEHWDAVAIPQTPGLAVLAMLSAMPGTPTGPVIWSTGSNLRHPRLYFLTTARSGLDLHGTPARLLGPGSHVVVPGDGVIEPHGVYWAVPPNPDQPDELTDPAVLVALLRRIESAVWVTISTPTGYRRQVLVSRAQADGDACLHCHATESPLSPGPTVTISLGDVARDSASALCTRCLRAGSDR